MKTQAIMIDQQGPASVMQMRDIEVPSPGPGEVQIAQSAIGLNFMDVYQRSGAYPLTLPSPLGLEAAGEVVAIGDDVVDLEVGQRVAYAGGVPGPGAYSGARTVPAARCIPVPDSIDDATAAAVLMKGLTAEYLLRRVFPVGKGTDVLFHAAAGGVGLIAGQIGSHMGANMIGIAGGAGKVQTAMAHGYAACIDRYVDDIAARAKALTEDKGVQVVYDSVGAATFDASLASLSPRGYFVSFGATTGEAPAVAPSTLQKNGSLYFCRPTLVDYTKDRAELLEAAAFIFDLVAQGVITVKIGQEFQLAQIVTAHEALEAGQTVGSTVIRPN